MIFELQGELILDNTKQTIVFMDKGKQDEYTHVYGASSVLKEKLKETRNIVTIGTGCGLTNNYYEVKRNMTKTLLRKSDGPDYREKNKVTLDKWYMEAFKDLPSVDYIVLGTDDFFRLPLSSYAAKKTYPQLNALKNEFFDYVGCDKQVLKDIDDINSYVIKDYDRLISPFAFSTCDYHLFFRAIKFIHETGRLNKGVIGFSIDPAIYTPYFTKQNIPSTFYYFAKDKRGTRNFEQLDIAQLQHIIYDEKFTIDGLDTDKTHNMFFAGTIFQDKGARRHVWEEFLKDVKSEKCSFYIPLKRNGINKDRGGKANRQESLLKENEDFGDLYEQVKNHTNFKGSLLPHEINERTKRYKYGMVFRCVSYNDSLNFRPVLYTYNNIVPFLDYQYDPTYLQIPKEIQDKIVVRSAKDIEERINFYNKNNSERVKVLEELKQLFRVDDYVNNPDGMVQQTIDRIFK